VSGRANSARRVAALHSEIRIPAALASSVREIVGSVVLVDDVVDLGWTLTLAAQALRRAGATDVFPFALATTGRRE
jgi:ATP-dependent DNA helicase RecQ